MSIYRCEIQQEYITPEELTWNSRCILFDRNDVWSETFDRTFPETKDNEWALLL